jgi:hypothetical protein
MAACNGLGISTDLHIADQRGLDSATTNPMTIRQLASDPVFWQPGCWPRKANPAALHRNEVVGVYGGATHLGG